MEDFFRDVCEARIRQAINRGELDNLAGAGKPLKIDNLNFLLPKLRPAYIILKNSGYLDSVKEKNNLIK